MQLTPNIIADLTEMAMALSPQQRLAIKTLATQAARNAIRRKLQAQGVKVTLVPQAQIVPLAEHYLRQHPELLTDAMMSSIVQGMRPLESPQQGQIHEGMEMAQ